MRWFNAAPEWAFDQFPHARYRGSDDSVVYSNTSASSATGGFPGLCLDNDDVRLLAEKYPTAMVERYRNHPATLGWDCGVSSPTRAAARTGCTVIVKPPKR